MLVSVYMDNFLRTITCLIIFLSLTGCVTQTYENDKNTPVIQNESSNNEIAMTRISLGLGYLKMGNTTQAKLNLEKAKRSAPKLVQVHTAFAHYYDTVGEPKLATQAYEKALSINGDDPDTLNNYGVFLCKQKKYALAEQKMLKAIAVPTYLLVAKSYENLALCQLDADAFDKAEHYLHKSIQHSPSNASAILHMMRLQYAKGDYQLAEQYLKRYEKATRRFMPEALALAFKTYQKQNKMGVAKNYASMLVKMFPQSFQAKQFLLNGLDHTEADELAEKYQLLTKPLLVHKKKKRVVKLSPKRYSAESINENAKQRDITKKSERDKRKADDNSAKSVSHVDSKKTETKVTPANESITTTVEKPSIPQHIVKKGDTLFSITVEYNIHMKALERWNNFSRNQSIKIGDVIFLADPKK
ncbi:type IV pilus biogenesis/stability protein PilW [Thalassotalea sp. 1_MG-2023]|uniref:type IV pilus biogenesis/stability protein PilW n=1 Tax=Thalassotalea sp. 1_MG-2023 TaxID=3062680 RepID=UPI0034A0E3AC